MMTQHDKARAAVRRVQLLAGRQGAARCGNGMGAAGSGTVVNMGERHKAAIINGGLVMRLVRSDGTPLAKGVLPSAVQIWQDETLVLAAQFNDCRIDIATYVPGEWEEIWVGFEV